MAETANRFYRNGEHSARKWRVVPKTVVAALGDNDRWECAQNPRAAFNACDIPEEAWEGDGK